MAEKSPKSFLASAEAMSPLKRKAHFSRLSSESLKRFRLDPAPTTEDLTITLYHERTQALMPGDRDKLHIQIPFEGELLQIQDLKALIPEVNDLRTNITDLQSVLTALRPKIDGLKVENKALRADAEAHRAETKALQIQNTRLQERRLSMLIANALIDLARMIAKRYKSDLIMEPSTTRLQQFAANLTDTQLQEMGVPQKFWSPLRRLEKYVTIRNQQAHETRGDFAQLLSDDQFKESHVFDQWKDIFPLLYGEPVEVIAAQQGEDDYKMLLGTL